MLMAAGRGRRRSARDLRARSSALAGLAEAHRDTPMVGPHAHPARRPDDLRAQGRRVADRRARRGRRPRGAAPSRCSSAVPPAPARRWSSSAAIPASWSPVAERLGLRRSRRGTPSRAPVTRLGDALVALHRRLGAGSPTTCSRCAAPEIGELAEGDRRRLVDDAAQGQPGAVGAGPPGRADHPAARRHPAPRGRPAGRRARRRRLARRVGDAARPACAARWSPPRRRVDLVAGLQVDADRMAATLRGARDERRRRAARHGRAGRPRPARRLPRHAGALVDAVLDRAAANAAGETA